MGNRARLDNFIIFKIDSLFMIDGSWFGTGSNVSGEVVNEIVTFIVTTSLFLSLLAFHNVVTGSVI